MPPIRGCSQRCLQAAGLLLLLVALQSFEASGRRLAEHSHQAPPADGAASGTAGTKIRPRFISNPRVIPARLPTATTALAGRLHSCSWQPGFTSLKPELSPGVRGHVSPPVLFIPRARLR